MSCVYTVGFYDRDPVEDRLRSVKVRVKRDGLRVMSPSNYVFRSDESKRESSLRAAFLSPELFRTGVVRAHVFPLRPVSGKRWEGLLAVGFPLPVGGDTAEPVERDFGAVLSRGPSITHEFNRRITLRSMGRKPGDDPMVTFLEPVTLKPGSYELTVVMAAVDGTDPHSAKVSLDVPKVPKKDLLLVPPVLGRRAGGDVVVQGGKGDPSGDKVGGRNSFRPLMVQRLDDPDDLLAMTEVCMVSASGTKRRGKGGGETIRRALADADGNTLGALPDVELSLEARGGKIRCQSLVDVVPAFALDFGEYVFEALVALGEGRDSPREEVRFAIGAPAAGPDAASAGANEQP
jgi:hypothetical protein